MLSPIFKYSLREKNMKKHDRSQFVLLYGVIKQIVIWLWVFSLVKKRVHYCGSAEKCHFILFFAIFFSATLCSANFSALKASIQSIENLRKSQKSVEIIWKLRKLTHFSVFKGKNSTKFQKSVEIFYRASEKTCPWLRDH